VRLRGKGNTVRVILPWCDSFVGTAFSSSRQSRSIPALVGGKDDGEEGIEENPDALRVGKAPLTVRKGAGA
jgi:hypothetical protein